MSRRRWTSDFEDQLRRTDYEGQLAIDGSEVSEHRVRPKKRAGKARQAQEPVSGPGAGQGDLFELDGVSS